MKLLIPILALIVWNCGNYEFDSNDIQTITVEIRVQTPLEANLSPNNIPGGAQKNVPINENIELWGLYKIDGALMDDDLRESHLQNSFWVWRSDTLLGHRTRVKFLKAGIETITFGAVDAWGDTIKTAVDLYVNQPLQVELLEPVNYNLEVNPCADPFLNLRWELSGLDAWESPRFEVFMGVNPDSLTLVSNTAANSLRLNLQEYCYANHTYKFYWRINATAQSPVYHDQWDKAQSELYYFQTKLPNSELSLLYYNYQVKSARLQPSNWLLAQNMHTREEINLSVNSRSFGSALIGPGEWRFIAGDSLRQDFAPDTTYQVLRPGVISNDTLLFSLQDLISPRVTMISSSTDSLKFRVFDGGAGINLENLTAISTTGLKFNMFYESGDLHQVYFFVDIPDTTQIDTIMFSGADLAGNEIPTCKWIYQATFNPQVSGPFCP